MVENIPEPVNDDVKIVPVIEEMKEEVEESTPGHESTPQVVDMKADQAEEPKAQKPDPAVSEVPQDKKSDESREQFRMEFLIKQLKKSEFMVSNLNAERDRLAEQIDAIRIQSDKQQEEMREYVESIARPKWKFDRSG